MLCPQWCGGGARSPSLPQGLPQLGQLNSHHAPLPPHLVQKFNLWLDRQLSKAHQPSLLVYPEGTRSLRDASLPLKRGMLRYAHSRRLPVQVRGRGRWLMGWGAVGWRG